MEQNEPTPAELERIISANQKINEIIVSKLPGRIVLNNIVEPADEWALKRYFALKNDMKICLEFLSLYKELSQEYPDDLSEEFIENPENNQKVRLFHAYHSPIIVQYCRSFTKSFTSHAPKKLDFEEVPITNLILKPIHEYLMNKRDKLISHVDSDSTWEIMKVIVHSNETFTSYNTSVFSRMHFKFDSITIETLKELFETVQKYATLKCNEKRLIIAVKTANGKYRPGPGP